MKQTPKLLFILLLILSSSHLSAKLQGQAKLDSLVNEIPKLKEDTNKVRLLNYLSFGYSGINPDEGIKYGQQGQELATKLNWKNGIAEATSNIAGCYFHKSDYPKTLECYGKAMQLNQEMGYKIGIASANINIGNVYVQQSNYPKALDYYLKGLRLDEECGNTGNAAVVTGNIGIIYCQMNDYPTALDYFLKALKSYEETGDKNGITRNTANIGMVYLYQKDYSNALEYFLKSLKLAEEIGNKYLVANSNLNIGIVYQNQKKYATAIDYYQMSLKIALELEDKNLEGKALGNIGETYVKIAEDTAVRNAGVRGAVEFSENKSLPAVSIPKGKAALIAGAIDYTLRSAAICRGVNDLGALQNIYENLSEAYKLKGDYKKAMEYGDSSKVMKDSVFSQTNAQKITALETKRKEYADSLTTAAAKITADVKAAHRRNYELIGGGVLLLAIAFIFMLTRNNKLLDKEKKKSDNLLLNILPEEVATQLKDKGEATARQFDNVTVLFTDFVNFTEAGAHMSPQSLIEELNTCFKKFDEITAQYNVEKIKTIGDAYLAVCGLPTADPKHAENIVQAAKEIGAFMRDRHGKLGNRTFEIRLGVHSGSAVAGIVGVKKFAYDIWGDTVNTAARMEQNSEAGKINISEVTHELVKDKFNCEYRGEIEAKGKGMMKMYYVLN